MLLIRSRKQVLGQHLLETSRSLIHINSFPALNGWKQSHINYFQKCNLGQECSKVSGVCENASAMMHWLLRHKLGIEKTSYSALEFRNQAPDNWNSHDLSFWNFQELKIGSIFNWREVESFPPSHNLVSS